MYQDSGGVEDGSAQYHIMYNHYDPIKLGQDHRGSLKLARVVQEQPTNLSTTTVTLSHGEALVTADMVDTSALTTTSLSHNTTPISIPATLTVSSQTVENMANSSGLTVRTVPSDSAMTADSSLERVLSNEDPLSVAEISRVGPSEHSQGSHVDLGHIVSTSGDGMIDGSLVTSSSIDAVVTSMVASADCQGTSGTSRKLPPQVIGKLFGEDTFSLDMVRIITEPEDPGTPHSFNFLSRNGTLIPVHAKLSDNSVIGDVGSDHYQAAEALRPSLRNNSEEIASCSVEWDCAYCHKTMTTSEAVHFHQEECPDNPSNMALTTTTSKSTVDALMSPIRHTEEPSYQLKIEERDPLRIDDVQDIPDSQHTMQEEINVVECITVWNCAVCDQEFTRLKDLNRHHLSHSIHELSAALLKLTTPQQRVQESSGSSNVVVSSFMSDTIESLPSTPTESGWDKGHHPVTVVTKLEEEEVDDPGDTPPHTPPQEKVVQEIRKKPGPRAKPREKTEKRKYVRRVGEDGKPLRPREYRTPTPGQSSRNPHTCYLCQKVLSSRGNLAKHLILHNVEKPWVCKVCNIGFNAKRDQQNHHLQHHTTQRPHVCNICGKGYVDSNYLTEHMIFHRKEKSFSCDICGKSFRRAKCVARHKKRHQKDKKYTCKTCFKTFAVSGDLTSHIRKVHRKKKGTQLKQQSQVEGDTEQQAKAKDLTEFLIPSNTATANVIPERLLQAELGPAVSTKEGIFIRGDTLTVPSIIPLSGAGENGEACSYSVALAAADSGAGNHASYILINSAEEEVASHTVSTTQGLNIMYAATPVSAQQVGELGGSSLEEMQQLVEEGGQLHHNTLHHLHTHAPHTPPITSDGTMVQEDRSSSLNLPPSLALPGTILHATYCDAS